MLLTATVIVQAQTAAHWPQWRGPFFNGMARGDAPTVWSDTSNIKWKTEIPGRGHSTPTIWGDRIFITTAIPTGKPAPAPTPAAEASARRSAKRWTRRWRWSFGGTSIRCALLWIARRARFSGSERLRSRRLTKVTIVPTAALPPTHRLLTASMFTHSSAHAASIATTSTEN